MATCQRCKTSRTRKHWINPHDLGRQQSLQRIQTNRQLQLLIQLQIPVQSGPVSPMDQAGAQNLRFFDLWVAASANCRLRSALFLSAASSSSAVVSAASARPPSAGSSMVCAGTGITSEVGTSRSSFCFVEALRLASVRLIPLGFSAA